MSITDTVLRHYQAEVFQHLNPFHLAKRFIEGHQHSLIELGDVICRHNLQDHVGISLLHKHFNISDNELVVREFVNDVAYMKPRNVDDITNLVPYLWKCEIANQQALYCPLEFCEYPDRLQDETHQEVQLINGSKQFLIEIAEKLEELELTAFFGIAALCSREPFSLGQEQTLLETTDEEQRLLTLIRAPQAEVDQIDTTQTLWTFTPPRLEVVPVFTGVTCSSHCGSHCYAHCSHNGQRLNDGTMVAKDCSGSA